MALSLPRSIARDVRLLFVVIAVCCSGPVIGADIPDAQEQGNYSAAVSSIRVGDYSPLEAEELSVNIEVMPLEPVVVIASAGWQSRRSNWRRAPMSATTADKAHARRSTTTQNTEQLFSSFPNHRWFDIGGKMSRKADGWVFQAMPLSKHWGGMFIQTLVFAESLADASGGALAAVRDGARGYETYESPVFPLDRFAMSNMPSEELPGVEMWSMERGHVRKLSEALTLRERSYQRYSKTLSAIRLWKILPIRDARLL